MKVLQTSALPLGYDAVYAAFTAKVIILWIRGKVNNQNAAPSHFFVYPENSRSHGKTLVTAADIWYNKTINVEENRKMDRDFHDIDIPPRMTEYALPLDTAVSFRWSADPAGLSLCIFSAGRERRYGGRGRILLADGFAKMPDLSILDPFLLDKRLIPARYFKIFFRAQLPKLRASGREISSELELAATPAVLFTIRSCGEDYAGYDLRWYAARDTLQAVDGFEGYVLSGGLAYRGLLRELRAIPHAADGAYLARDEELQQLRALYRAAPYLFDVRDTEFIRRQNEAPPAPAGIPVEEAIPHRKLRDWGGPALLRTGMTPQNRPGTARFAHFVVEAKRLTTAPAPPAEFVPFSCYWPTYANMSREQRAWYFYWRDSFQKGKVLKTDLSYIFVAVYEIINRAWPVGRESLERMLSLWESYRENFPRLDYYMSQWCVDYVLTGDIDFDFSEILRRIPLKVQNMRPAIEFYINEALKTGLHALPFDCICEFSAYRMENSRFYRGREEMCQKAVRAALAEIDRSLREAKQVGLLEYLAPRPRRDVWESFQGAGCGRAAARRIEAEYIPYSRSTGIRSFVASVMRYVENALRKREKYAGRLRSIELSQAVTRAIDRSLSGKTLVDEKAPGVVIDLSRAAELERDSWENTRRLIEAVGEDAPEEEEPVAPAEPEPEPMELAPAEELPTDGDAWQRFAAGLEPQHRRILKTLLEGGDRAALAAIAAESFSFPEAMFDEINEQAADTIGDIIIDAENGEIYEEHRESLAACL